MTTEHRTGMRQLRWLRAHPLAVDALVAVVVYAIVLCASVTVAHSPMDGPGFRERHLPGHTVVLTGLACAALVMRRTFPTCVLTSVTTLSLLEMTLGLNSHAPADRHGSVLITVVVALFTVAARTDRPTTWRVGLLTLAVVTPASMLLGQRPWYSSENLGIFAWTALAAVTGEAIRSRRAMVDAIRERAERAERTREEEARRRVTEERMRIARELHDVVAHHIALVNVQAGVASHVMDTRPDQAKQALSHIRQASRRALSELQTTVGLLRQQDEPVAPTEPARGLAVLDDLVDGFVRTGMSVTVDDGAGWAPRTREGGKPPAAARLCARSAEHPLPSAVDLAAYRVVQEALTNVHKHAGPRATALVRLVRTGSGANEALDITVLDEGRPAEDDGAPPAAPQPSGSGHGLTGMRERAAALGGSCEAAPIEGGGFRVRVRLPIQPPREPVDDTPAIGGGTAPAAPRAARGAVAEAGRAAPGVPGGRR